MILRNVSLLMTLNLLKAAATLLLSFLITRYVPPSEYGLIAFALPFVGLLSLLTDLGIASAILREKQLTIQQAGSTVSLMLALGLIACLLLAGFADQIESLSGVAGAASVLLGFAFVTCFQVWATAPRALLERIHSYNIVSLVEGISLLLALAVFFTVLMTHPGIYALVLYHVTIQASRAVLFLLSSRKCFAFVWIPRGIQTLIHAGGWIFIANLLSYASRNFDKLIIGKQLGQTELGMYGFAYQFMTIPLVLLAWPANNVLVSSLASAGENHLLRRDLLRAFVSITCVVGVPLATYICLGLDYPLQHFLSSKWSGVGAYISILMPVGVLQAVAVYASMVLITNGSFRLNFFLGLINGICIPLVMYFSVPYGLVMFVKSYALSWVFLSFLMIFFLCRGANISFKLFLYAIYPGLFSACMGVLLAIILCRELLGFFSCGEFVLDLNGWVLGSLGFIIGSCGGFVFCRRELLFCLNVLKKSRSDILAEG